MRMIRMKCPKCEADLYERNRRETTGGTFIDIRCSKCDYFDYKTIPVTYDNTTTGDVI